MSGDLSDTFFSLQHLIPTMKAMWGQQPTSFADNAGREPPGGRVPRGGKLP